VLEAARSGEAEYSKSIVVAGLEFAPGVAVEVTHGEKDEEVVRPEIRTEGVGKSRSRDAREEARDAALKLRAEGDEPQAGHRHRPVGSAAGGR
jgi:hypothetical protein